MIIELMFQLYDTDDSGFIDVTEMAEAIVTLYDMSGANDGGASNANAMGMRKAKRIFSKLDQDGDGELTVDEFVQGCMEDEELLELLAPSSIVGTIDSPEAGDGK